MLVVKKLDETPGYENVIRDSQRGNAIRTKQQELRRPSEPIPPRPLNGIETDPTLVSNLLKESLAKPAPITVQTEKRSPTVEREREIKKELKELPPEPAPLAAPQPTLEPAPPIVPQPTQAAEQPTEHKHKKEKKKKEKHKHKDRDKSKEERKEERRKHKKDKKKESPQPPPAVDPASDVTLRITIPRDKLPPSPGLKIKIPKERLAVPPPPPQTSGLKIKISKEVLETSRKRAAPAEPEPPPKAPRQNGAPPPKVGNWPPFRPQLPYYMMQPPPAFGMVPFMGAAMGMDGYFYPQMGFAPMPPPPLPAAPPPPLPPPPPE